MLTGENGLLTKVGDARIKNEEGEIKEEISLAWNSVQTDGIVNNLSLSDKAGLLKTELEKNGNTATVAVSGNSLNVTYRGYKATINTTGGGITSFAKETPKDPSASNLTDTELAAIEANNTANPTDQIEEITSSVTNINLQDTTKIKAVLTGDVPIPVRANYVEGTVDTGVVIEYKGSQFVWVPVPVTTTNSLYPKGTTKAMAKVSTAEGFAGTDDNGRINYEGVLYDFGYFDWDDYYWYTYSESQVMSSYGQGTEGYREPDIISDYDNDTETYLSAINLTQSAFKKEIQENYNEMIKSVSKYGGFYVGRYETSIDSTTTVGSKPGTPMSSVTDNLRWYGMYDKEKKFTTNTDVMQSSMIWGSQYDAMLNWMQKGGHNVGATDKGNHSGSPTTTGGIDTDIINNIYDLQRNLLEWTLEANFTGNRACRGGYWGNGSFAASYREGVNPLSSSDDSPGSRLSLYIK